LTVLADKRDPFLNVLQTTLPERKPDAHWLAFKQITPLLKKDNLEVVNVKHWMTTNSTLQNTKKVPLEDLLAEKNIDSDCIFLHSLYSHGLELKEFKKVVRKTIDTGKRTIVLEFNKNSKEISSEVKSLSSEDIELMFGKPDSLKFVLGEKSEDRNLLAVYNY
jgi:hypothetical protein